LIKTGNISYSDPRFNYPYKGFCSIVCGLIDMSLEHYIVNDNFNIQILEEQTLKLFDNISPKTEESYDVGPWWLERFFSNAIYQGQYNAHTEANIDNLKIKNKVYNSVFKIKDEYLKKFEEKKNKFQIKENSLAIQIRGTDKKTELPEPSLNQIIRNIDTFLEENKVENIFLATDDIKFLSPIIDRYDNISYDESILISYDGQPLHLTGNRDIINEEVLSNVYLLSNCTHFMYSFSNVSLLALIMGANNYKKILPITKL